MSCDAGHDPARDKICEEFVSSILPMPSSRRRAGRVNGAGYPGTFVWGYVPQGQTRTTRTSYLGPVVLAQARPVDHSQVRQQPRHAPGRTCWPTSIRSTRRSTGPTLLITTESQSLRRAPFRPSIAPGSWSYTGPIPAVVHLHGGEVPPRARRGPGRLVHQRRQLQWDTASGRSATPAEDQRRRRNETHLVHTSYPNTQEASNIWFHDHTLGATRLNVYAGLAGGYLIIDPDPTADGPPRTAIGSGRPIIPLVIQDRMFDTNGQLFFPADSAAASSGSNPEHPYWVPEFVGDTIVVNGKAWPYLECRAQALPLPLRQRLQRPHLRAVPRQPGHGRKGPPMWVRSAPTAATWTRPVKIDPNARGQQQAGHHARRARRRDHRLRRPAPGTKLLLRNTAKTPYPNGATPHGPTRPGRIMQFRVERRQRRAATPSYDPATGAPAAARTAWSASSIPRPGPGAGVTRSQDPPADPQRGHGDAECHRPSPA